MSKYRHLVAFMLVVLACLSSVANADARRLKADRSTVLQIVNDSNISQVATCITVPASGICGSYSISQFQVKVGRQVVPLTQLNNLQGWFNLQKGDVAILTNTATGGCLAGVNVAFMSPPQCPCTSGCAGFTPYVPGPAVPNGVNQAEVTLNVTPPAQEAVNISCNTGANTTIKMTSNGVGPPWYLPNGQPTNSFSIQNSWVNVAGQQDNNCNTLGVLAYQLSTCNAGPASCPGSGPYCSTSNPKECILQRSAVNGVFGGAVRIHFIGPLSPP